MTGCLGIIYSHLGSKILGSTSPPGPLHLKNDGFLLLLQKLHWHQQNRLLPWIAWWFKNKIHGTNGTSTPKLDMKTIQIRQMYQLLQSDLFDSRNGGHLSPEKATYESKRGHFEEPGR